MLRVVGCTCGDPQMGTDMVLKAEAWTGKPEDFQVDESWEKVDALFAVRLIEAFSSNPITRREITHMADTYLLKNKRQLPGRIWPGGGMVKRKPSTGRMPRVAAVRSEELAAR